MRDDGKDVLGFIAGFALIIFGMICGMTLLLRPSPMQICIKAGYEWHGGDCVKAVDHADQQ